MSSPHSRVPHHRLFGSVPASGRADTELPVAPRDAGAALGRIDATSTDGLPAELLESGFCPLQPRTLAEAGLKDRDVESLIVLYLLGTRTATGLQIADHVKLPFSLVDERLRSLKSERVVVHKQGVSLGDYVYELTDIGTERAATYSQKSTYCGCAPVPFADYIASVEAQSVTNRRPTIADVQAAFADLVVSHEMLLKIGQAIRAGRGLFLYGAPGNGKTTIAERVTRVLGDAIWIPRTLNIAGDLVRLYDPSVHEALPASTESRLLDEIRIDERWVRIRRPTVVVGGELTLDELELRRNPTTGISEAPVQMKSNCGTLVIDDFGRQRFDPRDLLNRWMMPLERRFDILSLSTGVKVRVPFDQLTVFATNLRPGELVEEAFLRRIPFKIEAQNPNEAQFRKLLIKTASAHGLACPAAELDYLIQRHYREAQRAMRFCHPRDLIVQIQNLCDLLQMPRALSRETIDAAAENYFVRLEEELPRNSRWSTEN